MKVEMESGKDGALCLRLVGESKDEWRALVMLSGAEVNTLHLDGTHGVAYLISRPVILVGQNPPPQAMGK